MINHHHHLNGTTINLNNGNRLDARTNAEGSALGAASTKLGAPVTTGLSGASEGTDSLDTTAATAPGCGAAEVDLLKEMVATSLGPLSNLSNTLNLTLDQVSRWIAEPENRRDIFNLLGLLDAQTQLLIAQQRLTAAVRLAQIMRDDEAGPETIRRACKDMLNMRLIERGSPNGRSRSRSGGSGGGVVTADDLAPLPLPMSLPEDLRKMLGGTHFAK